MSGIVALIDQDLSRAVIWLLLGVVIGVLMPLVLWSRWATFFEWYDRFACSPDHDLRMHAVSERLLDYEDAAWENDEEFNALIQEEMFAGTLVIAPSFGLFHGTLFGPIVGAVNTLLPDSSSTAMQGAITGLMIGPVFVSIVAACAMAYLVSKSEVGTRSVSRSRWLLLVSPLLLFPAAWHALIQRQTFGMKPKRAG